MTGDVAQMKEDSPHQHSNFYAAIGRLSAIITIIPASMAGGWIMGHYLVDRFLGTGPWGGIVCLFLGAGAGFYEITKLLIRSQGKSDTEPPQE
jgi:F0F1-type ATP synthase assembly protein I